MKRNHIFLLAGLGVFLLVMVAAVQFGNYSVSASEVFGTVRSHINGGSYPDSNIDTIVWKIRIPRVLTAAMAGMMLSISGAVFQGIFRNPLVEPYVLGCRPGRHLARRCALSFPGR